MRDWILILALSGLATPTADLRARDLPVVLSVKPVLCITDRRQQSCAMSFLVAWWSETEGNFCLYSDFATATPISCWARETSGRVEEDRVIGEPFTYWLTSADSAQRVAEATIDVVSTDVDDRRRNRRKRYAWSVL